MIKTKLKIKTLKKRALCEICRSDFATHRVKYKNSKYKTRFNVCDECLKSSGYTDFINTLVVGKEIGKWK